ncbi:Aste57867_7504 [Aphanomyces stellatus]|uniref:Aste57867_7504 protein n=1 Tax=Aphanomyces stellatus TaxID=120398 RepID=A0A485KIE9_9STRA|nr:hypothetical protein As57867_007478 [Aphanomyces stellatus]VFT84413.1 Aste57867_7504 [Aphanomyces stellatus]
MPALMCQRIVFLVWGLLLAPTVAHTWLDAMWCESSRDSAATMGYPRNYLGRETTPNGFDDVMSYRIENYAPTKPLCSATQAQATQVPKYPRLTCHADAVVHFVYNPNGHVTHNACHPNDPRGCDGPYAKSTNWYILWAKQSLVRGDLPAPWDAAAARPAYSVVGQGPYDDQMCGEGPKFGKMRQVGQPCHGTFRLPAVAANTRLSLVWFWPFEKVYRVGEEYTTCFDIDVVVT